MHLLNANKDVLISLIFFCNILFIECECFFMRKFYISNVICLSGIVLCLCFFQLQAFAVEEVMPDEKIIMEEILFDIPNDSIVDKLKQKEQPKTFTGKILHTESKVWDLFDKNGYEFKSGPVKNLKINGYFRFDNAMEAKRNEDFSSIMTFDSVELQTETLFANEKTKLSASYNFVRDLDYDNDFFEKVSNLFIEHSFNENQSLRIGNARVPVGLEGGLSSSAIKFVTRGQISRNFGDARSVGVRNIAKYKYLDYDIGFYDSSRFMQRLFQGQEFAGNFSLKPLSKYGDKYGKLKLGASIDTGNADNSYSVFGAHAQYYYKKLYLDFEYAKADGIGGKYIKRGEAHGFFTTLAYLLNEHIELLGRYDYYKNDNNDKVTQEFTAGVNYYTHPNCKFVLNYVYAMSDTSANPSHKIYMGARFSTSALLGDI